MSRHNFELISLGLIDLAKMKLDAMMAYIAHTGNDGISAVWMQTGRVTFWCFALLVVWKKGTWNVILIMKEARKVLVISPAELHGLSWLGPQ